MLVNTGPQLAGTIQNLLADLKIIICLIKGQASQSDCVRTDSQKVHRRLKFTNNIGSLKDNRVVTFLFIPH